jgi:hypothetical protein
LDKKQIKYLDPESNYNTGNNFINNSFPSPEEEEIKSIQRSIAFLRQDIRKMVREELTASLNGGIQG